MLGVREVKEEVRTERWSDRFGLFREDGKTPYPPAELPLARAMGGEVVRDGLIFSRTAEQPDGMWLQVSASPLGGGRAVAVFRDVTERKALEDSLAARNAELSEKAEENASLVKRLRLALEELSTPVLELGDDVLALPVVGVVDTQRSVQMSERLLNEVLARRARFVILDLTGVDVIDTSTADRLIKLARAVELLGAECLVSGIQPAVAETLIQLGVDFSRLNAQRNLKRALDLCLAKRKEAAKK
jgi:rsbT co-antagonist protein RsbR